MEVDRPSPDSDEALVALITQHQPLLRAVIRTLAPRCEEREDILQETNLILWRKRDTFQLGTNFPAWASTIARFQVMAWQQRKRSKATVSFDEALIDRLSEYATQQLSNLPERRDALNTCLKALSAENRELIEHRYTEQAPLSDFANKYGRSDAAVRKMLERIRSALRSCITQTLSKAHP